MLKKVASAELRVHVVWVPILPSDDEAAARQAAARFAEPRLRSYWDPDRALGNALGRVLALPPGRLDEGRAQGIAWDVYLLYERGARWSEPAPAPTFWMHQLDQVTPVVAPELDGAALRARVEAALGVVRKF